MSAGRAGWLARLRPDPYILLLVAMVVLASLAPARGAAAPVVDSASRIGIGLVFFLHGARLSPEAVRRGLTHWRLHLVVLAATFALFPLLGLGIAALPPWVTPITLAPGIVFLCCLPSTIQSSIGFVSIARGNVPAAVAAATGSNLLGVFLTPLLAGLLLQAQGSGLSMQSLQPIVLQLLAPFIAGQLLRPWIGRWVAAKARLLSYADRGSILLVVYAAFSHAVAGGIWIALSGADLARLVGICVVLLAAVLTATWWAARALGFDKTDEIAIIFCGSKKSLASGVPMAGVLFAPAVVGSMLLPIMIFHQIQLMACAVIAQRYAARGDIAAETR